MIYLVSKQTSLADNFPRATVDDAVDYLSDKRYIQVDTETEGWFNHKNRILTLQLGTGEDQFVIDFPFLIKEELDKLDSILFGDSIKILHNAKFDYKFLKLHGLRLRNVYDTMLAEQLLYAGIPQEKGFFALDALVARYTTGRLDKSIRGDIHRYGLSTTVIEYAANDVKYLEEILHQQQAKLISLGLANDNSQDELTILGLENRSVISFAEMEYHGMPINTAKWDAIRIEVKELLEKTEGELVDIICSVPELQKYCYTYATLFDPPVKKARVNWNSPTQKLEVLKHLDTSITDTSERMLSRYRRIPLVGKLLEYAGVSKLSSSFTDKLISHINPTTGRIHTQFNQLVATGRVSSSDPKRIWVLYL